ncbi:hypothetical protein KIN20_017474 [Parelaphostrongylus tenuis]|uniref:Uncharacterized protein n=1 Tax=Parelaphostrongylus tenuis TaxID=148309 RepID=A0AAD5MHZ0_PARTN|nr:hypothetical protein KIN20_017474 [Parelaphostrongylus tenuis]
MSTKMVGTKSARQTGGRTKRCNVTARGCHSISKLSRRVDNLTDQESWYKEVFHNYNARRSTASSQEGKSTNSAALQCDAIRHNLTHLYKRGVKSVTLDNLPDQNAYIAAPIVVIDVIIATKNVCEKLIANSSVDSRRSRLIDRWSLRRLRRRLTSVCLSAISADIYRYNITEKNDFKGCQEEIAQIVRDALEPLADPANVTNLHDVSAEGYSRHSHMLMHPRSPLEKQRGKTIAGISYEQGRIDIMQETK